jgi:PQQ-like domain
MPHRRFGSILFLASLAAVATAAAPPPPRPQLSIDSEGDRVVRRGPSGKLLWATPLEVKRWSGLVWDDAHACVSEGGGLAGLDVATGKVLWQTLGPTGGLLLDRGLVLAVDRHEVVARTAADGMVAFRVPLPKDRFRPLPLRRVAGLYLVQREGLSDSEDFAWLFDRRGTVRHRLDRQVVDGVATGGEAVILTADDVVRLGRWDRTRWTARFKAGHLLAGGGLVPVPGGDLLAFLHCTIADRGVEVMRLDPASGKVAWRAHCAGLGAWHSGYNHRAKLEVAGGRVRVTSVGSAGRFLEVLDLGTGVRVSRKKSSD